MLLSVKSYYESISKGPCRDSLPHDPLATIISIKKKKTYPTERHHLGLLCLPCMQLPGPSVNLL